MANSLLAEALEHNTTQFIPENQNYALKSSCHTPRAKVLNDSMAPITDIMHTTEASQRLWFLHYVFPIMYPPLFYSE
jgi:hypothetical protein